MTKYSLPDSEGVLVVYGTEPNAVHDFIKTNDLFEMNRSDPSGQRFVFKGENALLNSLTFLSSGEKKATVYFTQGNGELGFQRTSGRSHRRGHGPAHRRVEPGELFTARIERDGGTDKIPDDADIVVLARPREQLPAKVPDGDCATISMASNRKETRRAS